MAPVVGAHGAHPAHRADLGGSVIGGALANALDRVLVGAVVDFLNMSCCGIANPFAFNLADVGIVAGAIGLLIFADAPKNTS
jgi:signal peptidase II